MEKDEQQINSVSKNIFQNLDKYNHQEYQYLNLLANIINHGSWEEGRNGKIKSIFGASMRFSLKDNKIPILTTKKTAWKTCLKELLWFIRGETDNRLLKEQDVHIWDGNGSREYLDSIGLFDYEVDELGPIYGRQWRAFNKEYICNNKQKIIHENSFNPKDFDFDFDLDKTEDRNYGVDQLQIIIDSLKDPKKRFSRRHIMTAWNPCQLQQMALPPCHVLCQFSVKNGDELSCAMYQRSCDEACGTPFNIASYSFLTHLIAKHCGLKASEFVYFKGDCHIYEQHLDSLKDQLTREPYPFPTITIKQIRENINDYKVEDFEIHNYLHHPQIKFQMVV